MTRVMCRYTAAWLAYPLSSGPVAKYSCLKELIVCVAALILLPTRELALQTSQVCKELGKHMGVEVMVSTGGTSLRDDIIRLNATVHIVVGTPGRVLDLTEKGICKLGRAHTLVMDEVSHMC